MKYLVLVSIFVLIPLAKGDAVSNPCAKNLFHLNAWTDLSAQSLSCINSNQDFSEGISILCDSSRTELSVEFKAYLKYKKEYEDTLAWYQGLSNSQQQSAKARYKLQLSKENWENLGLKNTIRSVKAKLDESYRLCVPI